MGTQDSIKIIIESGKTEMDRGDMMIKSMCKVTEELLNYRYAYDNYVGNRDIVLKEKVNTIKNSLGVLMSEIMIYTETLGITEDVKEKADKRIVKIADKLTRI